MTNQPMKTMYRIEVCTRSAGTIDEAYALQETDDGAIWWLRAFADRTRYQGVELVMTKWLGSKTIDVGPRITIPEAA